MLVEEHEQRVVYRSLKESNTSRHAKLLVDVLALSGYIGTVYSKVVMTDVQHPLRQESS